MLLTVTRIINDSGCEANFTTSTGKENSYYIVNGYNNPLGELGYIRYDPDADYDLVFPLFVTDDLKNATYYDMIEKGLFQVQ